VTEERANIVKNIKDISAELFPLLDIKAMVFSGDKALKALDPKLLGLLKKPGDTQYTQLSPVLFANLAEIRGNELFKSPILVKVIYSASFLSCFDQFSVLQIARVLMFGKASLSNKKHGGPKGHGSAWECRPSRKA
jgi:hypothetical protein